MDAPREKTFLLAGVESRVLTWIARRLPRGALPDHMTALGVLAAIGIAAAYGLSNESSLWLWAASALLVVHWLGDSLDGTLARVRGMERPRYGYYLDHLVDALATALIGIGLGLGVDVLGIHATLLDAVGVAAAGGMLGALLVRAARNLRRLAEFEPAVR